MPAGLASLVLPPPIVFTGVALLFASNAYAVTVLALSRRLLTYSRAGGGGGVEVGLEEQAARPQMIHSRALRESAFIVLLILIPST
jgi:hypothetical protein